MKQTAKEIAIVALSIALVMAAVIAAVGGVSAVANSLARRGKQLRQQEEEQALYTQPANETAASAALSTKKIGWGIGPAKNDRNQPQDAVSAQQKYSPFGGHFLLGEEQVIYLTFDCGYENGFTEAILDTLAEKNVQATFFITGEYLDEAEPLVQRMLRDGHVIGNHTEKHPSLPDTSRERAAQEVAVLHERVKDTLGYEMQLFRFPMGEFSEQTLQQLQSMGYQSLFWSFAYKDWLPDAQPDKAASLSRLTASLHPGGIYLLHAVSSTNTAILGSFIDAARAAGYRFGYVLEDMGLTPKSEAAPQILDGNLAK